MSTEHSHTGPRGTIYHIHIDDTPPDGPLAGHEEYTVATEEELEYEATIAHLRAQNAQLLAALELAGHTSMCSEDSTLTPTAKEGRGLCERCAAIASSKEEQK